MRWFLDTEFNDDGRTIDLISLALVSESGRELEWTSSEFDEARCGDWLKKNVLPHLPPKEERVPREVIAREVYATLVGDRRIRPQIWAYFADYDWVAFCQLYGPLINLPEGLPRYCRDLKQLMDMAGYSKADLPPQLGTSHNALEDARWVRDGFVWIKQRTSIGYA